MNDWTSHRVAVLVLLGGSLAVAAGLGFAASEPQWQALALAVALLPLIAGLSRLKIVGLVAAFVVSQNLTHFVKRAVFLLGPQPQAVYFGIQLFPLAILVLLCATAFRGLRRTGLSWSGRLLLAYITLAVATTVFMAEELSWSVVLAAIHQQLLPFCLFFVGLSLRLDQFAKIGRCLALLAAISVAYGLLQLVSGPTPVDRAWAAETYRYSIQGAKVFAYLEGVSQEFRAFSYYADPLTWGLFLVAALLGASVSRATGRMGRLALWSVVLSVLVGLFLSLTRTSWVGLLATLGTCWLLKGRFLHRSWLVFGMVVAAFGLVVVGGEYLYRELFLGRRLPALENTIAARYITVGTIEARISAFEALGGAAKTAPLVGRGYGLLHLASRSPATGALGIPSSHNFLVELVLAVGVPGCLLFLWFYFQLLREGFAALRNVLDGGEARALRWMIAFSIGSVITGYLNGPTFMTYEFFLVAGVLAGQARRAPVEIAHRAAPVKFTQGWSPHAFGPQGGLVG